ncbi:MULTISPECIES: hypothetical protein [Microbacterium]|uniref:hypothetical protein n=1 Tax=Microbacterium TaxID=33882 RepID=UPI0025F36326|nr:MULTISPECIES: hypothetical protein [Microbacterium]
MGYKLVGGPQDGEYSEELPEGYVPQGINAGIVSREGESHVPRAVWKADLDEAERIIAEQRYRPTEL